MNFEGINFPIYRKYKNNFTYFKIIDARHFEELQVMGTKLLMNKIEAKSFPEINFINDLIFKYEAMADEISELEYVSIANSKH